jgi:hypothetical protein
MFLNIVFLSLSIGTNVLGLCEEADLEAQMFNLAQMLIRIPNVQYSTEPAFSQNPCYVPFFYIPLLDFSITLFGGIDLLPISDFLSIPFT